MIFLCDIFIDFRGAYLFIVSCNVVLNTLYASCMGILSRLFQFTLFKSLLILSNELCVILRCSNVNGSLQCVRLFG